MASEPRIPWTVLGRIFFNPIWLTNSDFNVSTHLTQSVIAASNRLEPYLSPDFLCYYKTIATRLLCSIQGLVSGFNNVGG